MARIIKLTEEQYLDLREKLLLLVVRTNDEYWLEQSTPNLINGAEGSLLRCSFKETLEVIDEVAWHFEKVVHHALLTKTGDFGMVFALGVMLTEYRSEQRLLKHGFQVLTRLNMDTDFRTISVSYMKSILDVVEQTKDGRFNWHPGYLAYRSLYPLKKYTVPKKYLNNPMDDGDIPF